MLSIFKRKHFLLDLLQGFTDIHNHILPGIDDGAATVEESILLLSRFRELGITDFIATPHIMNDYYPNTPATVGAALHTLQRRITEYTELQETGIKIAAEYMMDQIFLEKLENEKLLTLKDNYVLVEMSYFQAPINLNEILFKLQTQSYRPVLAHPERYVFFHTKDLSRYEELKNRGCLFQLNALSLVGHYGYNIQLMAKRLIDLKMIDYIATDTHRLEHLEKLKNTKIPKKHLEQIKAIVAKTKDTFATSI